MVDIVGGYVFYPDGITEIYNGTFVDAASATTGLRQVHTLVPFSAEPDYLLAGYRCTSRHSPHPPQVELRRERVAVRVRRMRRVRSGTPVHHVQTG